MMDYLDKLTQLAQVRGEINIRCLFQGDWQVEHQQKRRNTKVYFI